ncbi:MAG: LutB/LldF family L-lactate oxidation iron-sulfur protein [Thermodesulfobacteriota bacterium]|nr:LutB/LldF family L-lactate oxidation iron-sulfur protein [Thermodesulfobacteriota bacterium]
MGIKEGDFRTRSAMACGDVQLGRTLKKAALVHRAKIDKAFAKFERVEEFRGLARAAKEHALDKLPELLTRLEDRVRDVGGVVHWAGDANQAKAIVLGIAQKNQVRSVVKGKSMATEEIGLNKALLDAGIEVLETDLGQYIVQLANEPPSHITAPAVHKTRFQVADLFAEKLNVPRTEDIGELTLTARAALRQKFLCADMGVTGANMAVAETGSIVLVENEGNIRLTATAPRIHVAVMGIEKVVENLDDAAVILSLLARTATGQTLSSYTSVITGPRLAHELDGPEEFHLVLIDNGRSAIFSEPDFREILYCLRCGHCLSVCPVYEKVGGHSYASVYPGPIGCVLTPLLAHGGEADDLPFACTGCGACAEECPVRINIPKLLLALRNKNPKGETRAKAFAWLAGHPGMYRATASALRSLDPKLAKARRAPILGRPLRAWAKNRSLPKFKKPFSKRWPRLEKELEILKGKHGE